MIGIDPGQSGGAVMIDEVTGEIWLAPFAKMTDHDIAELFEEWGTSREWVTAMSRSDSQSAIIEQVHSMPKQGVASSFKFGRSYGFLIGLLTGLKIPYRFVTPQTWQKAMGCLSHGDKNVTKAAAQRLWPNEKWTHAIADAALIAEYGRRTKA